MMTMDMEAMAKAKDHFAARKVGSELVLVPLKGSVAELDEMFTISEVGSVIWEHIAPDSTEHTLVEAILEEFDIDRDTATADLRDFLTVLSTHMRI
jgi:hypothetical protein